MDVSGALLVYANRGVRLQLLVRDALVVFLALTIVLLPPTGGVAAYATTVVVYAVGAIVFARWAWRGGDTVARWGWLGLFADLVVLSVITLIAGTEAHLSWTSSVLVTGFFIVPVLAATQLREWICTVVVVPTVVVYLASSVATAAANDEPWESIALRTFMLAAVGVACVGLSRIQRFRVETIGALLVDRNRLLGELIDVEERQRRELAERIHDGALQYVLAARLDVDDLRSDTAESSGEAVDRVDHALVECSKLLRSTVSELHPAVLEHAGLASALYDLAHATARPDLAVDVNVDDWPTGARTAADQLLFGAARELVSNAVKHADAHRIELSLVLDPFSARLVVTDDGRGLIDGERHQRLEQGHIGLYTQTLRVQAAGGTIDIIGSPSGTTATVTIPGQI